MVLIWNKILRVISDTSTFADGAIQATLEVKISSSGEKKLKSQTLCKKSLYYI